MIVEMVPERALRAESGKIFPLAIAREAQDPQPVIAFRWRGHVDFA
jgi:hypothetical protein